MADRDADSGIELVLDNRKFIIFFVVLIAICGAFFVLGFMEGKRQGAQEIAQSATVPASKASPDAAQTDAAKPAETDAGATPAKENTDEPQLSWYKSVNRKEGEPEVAPKMTESSSARKAVEPAPAPKSAAEPQKKPAASSAVKPSSSDSAVHTGPVTYSVQVGAFRVRREAEIKAKTLQSKGFECRIDVPHAADELYLLKVGKFSSRSDAVAMQLRLKKSGIASFIKTN